MSDVVVLNRGLEQRTSASGKQRYTIKVTSEPLIFDLDPRSFGRDLANAVAHHFRERIKGITAVAAPATLKARAVAERAFKAGKPWALKRYAGGRTGPLAPNQTNRAFNDSTRFEKTITANASSDGAWRVNVAANRLSGDPAMVQRIWNRLVDLVPEFSDPSKLMENDVLRKTVERSVANMRKKLQATARSNAIEIARQVLEIGRKVDEIASGE